jgi:hypothetical protein
MNVRHIIVLALLVVVAAFAAVIVATDAGDGERIVVRVDDGPYVVTTDEASLRAVVGDDGIEVVLESVERR